ncbi:MAG: trypsin-like serine protease [Armatimonadetes bacterium]|nr:trypsin-like serine protease [Akkermansiaceae bacterium]
MAKKPNEQKKQDSQDACPFQFLGDRQKPDTLEELLNRRSIHGDRKIPAELRKMMLSKNVYLTTDKKSEKPRIGVQRLEDPGPHATWEVNLPLNENLPNAMHARPGQTAIREKPESFFRKIDPKTPFGSHRPSWIDASFSPKIMTQAVFRKMSRFNKRSVEPLYVFGPDDRWAFRDPAWPWGLTGKVFTSGGWTGSATLIGDRIIATAGHVVPWNNSSWWMRFVPAYYDGVSLHGAGVESYVSDARGFDVAGNVTGYDWAVCRLYEPLGAALGYFGYNGYTDNWENDPYWSIIGYPSAIAGAQRPTFQGSVTSDDTDGDSNGGLEIETKADLTPGNSGGPMFGWWSGDPRLIGVISGQEEEWSPGFWPWEWADTELTNVAAGGAGFTNLMSWGRSNWPH